MGLWGGGPGGVGEGERLGARAYEGRGRTSGTRSGPFVCGAGEAGRGARSLGSGDVDFHGTGSVHMPGAHSRAHKRVRLPPDCPPGVARSSALGGASAGSLRGGVKRGERAAGGGRPGRGLEGRNVAGRGSAGVPGREGRSWVSSLRGSR